jgi:hypothetical protein
LIEKNGIARREMKHETQRRQQIEGYKLETEIDDGRASTGEKTKRFFFFSGLQAKLPLRTSKTSSGGECPFSGKVPPIRFLGRLNPAETLSDSSPRW